MWRTLKKVGKLLIQLFPFSLLVIGTIIQLLPFSLLVIGTIFVGETLSLERDGKTKLKNFSLITCACLSS